MEFIVKDIGGDWYFDGDKTYFCLDGDKQVGKIYIEYIPDFYEIWESKCKMANVGKDSEEGKMYKPSQVIKALWEHKYALGEI